MKELTLIVGAMCAELTYFKNKLGNPKHFFSDVDLYTGTLNEIPVALLYTGIGKTNAAFALTEALFVLDQNAISVKKIVNIGLAGGFGVKLGEIVRIKHTTFSDFDLSVFNDPVPSFDLKLANALELKEVVCFTADRFVTSPLDNKESAYVCDMELTSLAQIAEIKQIPLSAFKIVSDLLDSKSSQINEYFGSKRPETMAKLETVLFAYLEA